MPKLDRRAALLCAVLVCAAQTAPADEPAYRHEAAIAIEEAAPFVRLPLPVAAFARSRQSGLADLRIVDANGQRVPFALLAPRASEARRTESLREATLYPLPARRAGETSLGLPVKVEVVGDRISVTRLAAPAGAAGAQRAQGTKPAGVSAGWLFDLGERGRDEAAASSLRLSWSGPKEFSAGFDIQLSDDLRQWRAAGGGQLLALASASGALTQPNVALPAGAGRFVRLVWWDAANAPAIAGAQQVRVQQERVTVDAPTTLLLVPGAEPVAAKPAVVGAPAAAIAPGALHFDLGAVLPVVALDLQLAAPTQVAPVRVQGRNRIEEPWRELAQTVFYRLERGGTVHRPPPLALHATVRYLRLVPDPRSGPLGASTSLSVQAQLASVVFATQGQAPYVLQVGSVDATPGALPLTTLVPALEQERPRLGRASLGAWREVPAVVRQEEQRARLAALRPWLLWAVLLAGVAGLGFMVWRLARRPNPPTSRLSQAEAERST